MSGFSEDYEVALTSSDIMQFLTDTNDMRIEEELTRPRVEIWPDDWNSWISMHDNKRKNLICNLPSMKASPFCALGYH